MFYIDIYEFNLQVLITLCKTLSYLKSIILKLLLIKHFILKIKPWTKNYSLCERSGGFTVSCQKSKHEWERRRSITSSDGFAGWILDFICTILWENSIKETSKGAVENCYEDSRKNDSATTNNRSNGKIHFTKCTPIFIL